MDILIDNYKEIIFSAIFPFQLLREHQENKMHNSIPSEILKLNTSESWLRLFTDLSSILEYKSRSLSTLSSS